MASSTTPTAETHEHQLARLEAEVLALRGQLHRTQRLATVGTMTAMVAHEFNNILTPIISYADLARKNPDMVPKALARAADGGQRARDISSAIMGIACGDSGDPVQLEVADLIAETIIAMAREPKRDGIEIIYRGPADLSMTTRKVELQQVLLNLLLNARAAVLARPTPRRIEIVADRCEDSVVLRVNDNGVGIEAPHLKRIFDPFFTTREPTDDKPGGRGLGLAICRQIVTALHGEISVESTPGQGATFTLCLPI